MLDGMEEGSYRFRDQIWITGLGRGGDSGKHLGKPCIFLSFSIPLMLHSMTGRRIFRRGMDFSLEKQSKAQTGLNGLRARSVRPRE